MFGDVNEGHPGYIMSQVSYMYKRKKYLYPKMSGSEWILHAENKCL